MMQAYDFLNEKMIEVEESQCVRSEFYEYNFVKLANGLFLRNLHDGRYYDEFDNAWIACFSEIEYDEDGIITRVKDSDHFYKL